MFLECIVFIKSNPPHNPEGTYNFMEYRPLEGFVLAITPFNFASIAGNLPTAPAIMGNTSLWKPASSALYPPYIIMKILKESRSSRWCNKFPTFKGKHNKRGVFE